MRVPSAQVLLLNPLVPWLKLFHISAVIVWCGTVVTVVPRAASQRAAGMQASIEAGSRKRWAGRPVCWGTTSIATRRG